MGIPKMLFSIVLAGYKTAPYLPKALDSVKAQSFRDFEAICYANIFLRTAERILLLVGEFKAETFEDLFQGTKNIPWENYIPKDGKFWVTKAASVKSKLFSPSDIQSVMKKAMVERMKPERIFLFVYL